MGVKELRRAEAATRPIPSMSTAPLCVPGERKLYGFPGARIDAYNDLYAGAELDPRVDVYNDVYNELYATTDLEIEWPETPTDAMPTNARSASKASGVRFGGEDTIDPRRLDREMKKPLKESATSPKASAEKDASRTCSLM